MQNYLPHAKALARQLYRASGARRTYAHARKLRETPTRHLYGILGAFAIRANQRRRGGLWRQPRAGDASSLALSSIYT